MDHLDQLTRPLGWVPATDPLAFTLIHGEPLIAAASWALQNAGVDLIDIHADIGQVHDSGRMLVLHDPLCPLTPTRFLAEAIALAIATGEIVAAYRPVTDTITHLDGDRFTHTEDRDQLRAIASPVVIPAGLTTIVADPDEPLPRLLDRIATAGHPIRWIQAPTIGRRVVDADDVRVLEAASRAAAGS